MILVGILVGITLSIVIVGLAVCIHMLRNADKGC